MTPLAVSGIIALVLIGGWFLWYKSSMMKFGDDAGPFKLVMIIMTPVFVIMAIILAIYAGIITFVVPFVLDWLQAQ